MQTVVERFHNARTTATGLHIVHEIFSRLQGMNYALMKIFEWGSKANVEHHR